MNDSKKFPVVEIFGPTIQGEGPDGGRPCLFVRMGGCDYLCEWCDSLHAVLPVHVRNAERLTAAEIAERLAALCTVQGNERVMTVVISGGNPALHDLTDVVSHCSDLGFRVTVETQGSKWKPWLGLCDLVVCSPKPPSSNMVTDWNALEQFVWNMHSAGAHKLALKVVVGDAKDYEYAKAVHARFPDVPFYLSVLNVAGSDEEAFDINNVLDKYRWLCGLVAFDPTMRDARVMPQLHTLAWGAEKGV